MTLAIANTDFIKFDPKTRKFVDDCIDYVEDKFAGTVKFDVEAPATMPDEESKSVTMFRLKPMVSNPSVYNKILAPNNKSVFEKQSYANQLKESMEDELEADEEQLDEIDRE